MYPYLRIRGRPAKLKLSPFSNGFLLSSSGPPLMPTVPRYAYTRIDRHTDGRTKSGLNTIAPLLHAVRTERVARTQNITHYTQQSSQRHSSGRRERRGDAIASLTHFCTVWWRRPRGCGHVIMAARSAPQVGRFHLKCSNDVSLSEDGKTAWTNADKHFGIAFSKEPISRGQKFSVKVLVPAAFNSFWVSQTIDREVRTMAKPLLAGYPYFGTSFQDRLSYIEVFE